MTAQTLSNLLARAADRWPDATAVEANEESISYKQLAARAGALAAELIDNGVTAGDRVGVLLPKSIQAVCSQYGIMWAGAAYVPLDPAAPAQRHALMVQNCGISVLITTASALSALTRIPDLSLSFVILVDEREIDVGAIVCRRMHAALDRTPMPHPVPVESQGLAYILHTSGSTGVPKGVMISHGNAMAFVSWARETIGVNRSDRLSSHAPFHFDLSVFDLYVATAAGATVVLVPDMISIFPVRMAEWIETRSITVWYSVPSVLVHMLETGKIERFEFSALRKVLFAGEVFATKYLRAWKRKLPAADWYNLYGPTETNVCTYFQVHTVQEDDAPISIGQAASGDTIFLVDAAGRTVNDEGVEGEIWASGPSVALGYWGDEQKTRERFVIEPEVSGSDSPMYRTGDFACWSHDRTLIFKGRRDHMVKSRGYRIELGEIEAAIYRHPAVVEACVVAIPDEDAGSLLRACVVADGDMDSDALIQHLGKQLPRYMLPQEIRFLELLPKTSTGKIDRQALLA